MRIGSAERLQELDLQAFGGQLFGDGSDGDYTATGVETISRPMFYRNLTIPAGVTFNPLQWPIYVSGTLTFADATSIIATNGNAAALNVAGAAIGAGAFGASGAGGAGDAAGTVGAAAAAGVGGAGGTVGALAGGASAVAAARAAFRAFRTTLFTAFTPLQGGGGGAGGRDSGDVGAGGGGGAGIVWIQARNIVTTSGAGIIRAKGGAGAAGVSTNADGGCGGGGGAVMVVSNTIGLPCTVDVSGGALGAAVGSGLAGTAGASGISCHYSNI